MGRIQTGVGMFAACVVLAFAVGCSGGVTLAGDGDPDADAPVEAEAVAEADADVEATPDGVSFRATDLDTEVVDQAPMCHP